ncbi:hypothetical protein [Mesorhizobium sp. B1-1-8]|uniref:hypothetical protein n=1 Tax=Mesorhizobium sp. B1-1-8 TaxID=2589976 RepID=UPI001129CE64|nr:hypothetical protein [Mesorhizobium sp. B1-1-8]UCI05353.1 hypothetical protein FJ974_15970 [Mesorhizobium sp. B1-1-8]
MLRKVIAASALVLAMATSAMAQSSDDWWWWHRDRPVTSERDVPVDRTTTGSIYSGNEVYGPVGNPPSAAGPCASDTAGPDANANGNVNDQYCGK